MSSLQTSLLKTLSASGWLVRSDGSGISAEREELLSKWLFGKHSVSLRLELKLNDVSKTVTYSESAVEEKTGWLPPGRRVDPLIGMAEHEEARLSIEKQAKKFRWIFEEKVAVPALEIEK
ncbi:MAG: hypothetical protein C4516_00870 [Oxalobacter sp.]|nr:MAG: hypothetical protein C4516_00870 [Oxalobacter sp.]